MSRVASDWNEADSQELQSVQMSALQFLLRIGELLECGRLFDAKRKRRAVWIAQDAVMGVNGFIHIHRSRTRPLGFGSTAGIGD